MKKELDLGLDVHKDNIITAVAEAGRHGEVRDTGAISNGSVALSPEPDGLARGKSVNTLAAVFWDRDGEIGGAVAPHESLREPCRVGPAEAALTSERGE